MHKCIYGMYVYMVCMYLRRQLGKVYVSPFDFGWRENGQQIFGPDFPWITVFLPSTREPPVIRVPDSYYSIPPSLPGDTSPYITLDPGRVESFIHNNNSNSDNKVHFHYY